MQYFDYVFRYFRIIRVYLAGYPQKINNSCIKELNKICVKINIYSSENNYMQRLLTDPKKHCKNFHTEIFHMGTNPSKVR